MKKFTSLQRYILAIGTAGIAATGAIFGAQLKTDRQAASAAGPVLKQAEDLQVAAQRKQAEQEEEAAQLTVRRIAALEMQRKQLLTQRGQVEKKMHALEQRRRSSREKKERREEAQEVMGKK